MRSIDLGGRAIAITGASSGIGAATAIACARAGMNVVLGARRGDRLRELAERINQERDGAEERGRAVAVECDVTRVEDCRALVGRCVEEFGSIYAVFANAGYGIESAAHTLSDEQLRAIFETNFFGTMNTIRPYLDVVLGAGSGAARAGGADHGAPGESAKTQAGRTKDVRGHVLICSSCLSRMSLPHYSAYSATKAAQAHVGRSMRLELEPFGVKVSTVHPITTATEFFDAVRTETGGKREVSHIPRRFAHTAERVAGEIVRCLRRPRAEVWPSVEVRLGMALAAAFPGLEDVLLLRRMARRKEMAAERQREGHR